DEQPVRDLESDPGAQELGAEDGQVESRDVVTREIAAAEERGEVRGELAKARLGRDVSVRQTVDGGRSRGDRDAGVESADPSVGLAVRMNLHAGDLDDAIGAGIGSRRLRVEEDERTVQGN